MFTIAPHSLPLSPAAGVDLMLALSLKATVVLGAAALATLVLHRGSAAARHLAWTAALLGVLALPLLAMMGPGWSVRGLALPSLASGPGPAPSSPAVLAPEAVEGSPASPASEAAPPRGPAPEAATAPVLAEPPARPEVRFDFAALVISAWAIGAAVVLGWLLLGAWLLGRISRRARPVTDAEWLSLVERCARQLGVRGPIELASSERVPVPCAWGVLRPRVLIPEIAGEWPVERRRAVLLHELAHVARRDCLVQTLAQVACALFWFHPLAWVAAWRLRVERERACDDLVLRADTPASDYADHLLAVVRSLRRRRMAAIGEVAFARPSQLEGRLLAVLDPDRPRGALTATRACLAALVAAATVLPLAALRPWSEGAEAGMTLTDAVRSRPEDGAASELVRAPESEVGLARRLGWAMAEGAKQRTGFWVAYAIPRAGNTSGNLSDSGPIELRTLNDRWPGARMADVLAGRKMRDPRVAPNRDVMVLAFHFPPGTTRPASVDRIRVQSEDLAAAFERQPLFWLGDIEEQESLEWVEKLEAGLRDSELRSAALHAVGSHRDDQVVRAYMTGVLKSSAPDEVRSSAAERMARFGDAETVDLLVATLHDDGSEEVRGAAVQALGQMHSDASTRALSKLARDRNESEDLRRRAIEALGEKANAEAEQTLDELVAAPEEAPRPEKPAKPEWSKESKGPKESKDSKASKASVDLVTKITPRPGGQDIEVLDAEGRSKVTIEQRKGKQKIESHEQGIQSTQVQQEEIQRQAVGSLGRFPEATSLPKLVKIARTHPNTAVRREAVSTIGQIESPGALTALLDFAWQDHDEDVARDAVDALQNQDGSLSRLIDLARKHRLTAVRRQAVQVLSNQGPEPQVLGVLDELVRGDSDEEVQREAVDAIGHMPEEASLRRLEKIARSHPRLAVRRQAIDALGNLDPDKAVPILESLIGQDEENAR